MRNKDIIENITKNNEFFNIDYEDLIKNFSTDNEDEGKDKITLLLNLQNLTFIDSVRGDIPRNRFIDRLITTFRHEFIEALQQAE